MTIKLTLTEAMVDAAVEAYYPDSWRTDMRAAVQAVLDIAERDINQFFTEPHGEALGTTTHGSATLTVYDTTPADPEPEPIDLGLPSMTEHCTRLLDEYGPDGITDPEAAHAFADGVLLASAPGDVAAAYSRLLQRAPWWASA